jgi:predicted GH43/DUF377 family glycosyl hydrolase
MNQTFELRDRVSCPPGGFVYKRRDGRKSDQMPYYQAAVEMARAEHRVGADDALQMVLSETYLNIRPEAREHFITKNTEGLIFQNRTFRYVPSEYLAKGDYHYNPGLIEHEGADHLIYRRQFADGNSTIHRFNFTDHANEQIVVPVIYQNEQFEDPRVFKHLDRIHLIFSSWQKDYKYRPILRLVVLDNDWKFEEEIPLKFGGNGAGVTQKNWQFWSQDGELFFLYYYAPWQVVRLRDSKVYAGRNLTWDYGEIRGGTPPVLVGDKYYSFIHSRLDHGRAKYYTGAVCFEAEEPFKPISMTMHPLLSATNKEPDLRWAPLTTFPCGCIYREGKFIVSLGINDRACGLCDWTMEELSALLRPL